MKPWFRSKHPERLASLRHEASRWIGTPFFPNSCSPGACGGASCQKLVAAMYRGAGFCPVEVPDAPMAHARFNGHSLVEEFMSGRAEFERLPGASVGDASPGDLLGFRLLRTIHHLGVCVEPGVFVHAIEHLGTTRSALADPTWGKRLAAIWRPVEL